MAANQSFLDNLTSLPALWNQIKTYTKNNRFSEARFDIDVSTGHLIAGENGNLKFSVDANGHLISEVK